MDFFNAASQRVALSIAANAAQFVSVADFNVHVRPCLAELTQRLQLDDKRSLESVVTLFSRLADNLRPSEPRLVDLCSHGLLANVQQLLTVQPPPVSSQHVYMCLRMLRVMAERAPSLAVQMIRMNVDMTLTGFLIDPVNQQVWGLKCPTTHFAGTATATAASA